jgi:hypothetical protein
MRDASECMCAMSVASRPASQAQGLGVCFQVDCKRANVAQASFEHRLHLQHPRESRIVRAQIRESSVRRHCHVAACQQRLTLLELQSANTGVAEHNGNSRTHDNQLPAHLLRATHRYVLDVRCARLDGIFVPSVANHISLEALHHQKHAAHAHRALSDLQQQHTAEPKKSIHTTQFAAEERAEQSRAERSARPGAPQWDWVGRDRGRGAPAHTATLQ